MGITENAKKFLELVSKDETLCEKVSKADNAALIAMSRELGIELTDADFEQPSELSDDELDAMAGGGRCICSFGGGGKASEGEKTCACVMGGGGENTDVSVRCVCIIGGDGNW